MHHKRHVQVHYRLLVKQTPLLAHTHCFNIEAKQPKQPKQPKKTILFRYIAELSSGSSFEGHPIWDGITVFYRDIIVTVLRKYETKLNFLPSFTVDQIRKIKTQL